MLISIDVKIAFDVIHYQILNNEMQESHKSKRKQNTPQNTLRKKENLIHGIYQKQKPNF